MNPTGAHGEDVLRRVAVTILPDGRMDRKNAALYLGLSAQTLANLAVQKRGPRIVRVAGRCFYFRSDLDKFIRSGADPDGDEPPPAQGTLLKVVGGRDRN
jgi:hypothetical protein